MKNEFVELNYTNFARFLEDKVVLVDFWAEWCHPCKVQHKILEDLWGSLPPYLHLARVNTDDNRLLANEQSVRNLPTLILYHHGREIRRFIGLTSRDLLLAQILAQLSKIQSHDSTKPSEQ